eukprot:CFRG1734T1
MFRLSVGRSAVKTCSSLRSIHTTRALSQTKNATRPKSATSSESKAATSQKTQKAAPKTVEPKDAVPRAAAPKAATPVANKVASTDNYMAEEYYQHDKFSYYDIENTIHSTGNRAEQPSAN